MVKEYIKIPFVEYNVILKVKDPEGNTLMEFPEITISDGTDKWDALVKAASQVVCFEGKTLDKVVPMAQLWKWASIKKAKPAKEYHRRVGD